MLTKFLEEEMSVNIHFTEMYECTERFFFYFYTKNNSLIYQNEFLITYASMYIMLLKFFSLKVDFCRIIHDHHNYSVLLFFPFNS